MTSEPSETDPSNVFVTYETDGTRVVSRTMTDSAGKRFVIEHRSPSAIRHLYQPSIDSEDIPLYRGYLAFSDHPERSYSGSVDFTWRPNARIRMRGARTATTTEISELFDSSSDTMWRTVPELIVPPVANGIPQPPPRDSIEPPEQSGDLRVEERVHTQVGDGEHLDEVTFLVPNGWQALDATRVCDPDALERTWFGRTTADGDGWSVQFDRLCGLTQKEWTALKKVGGHSFTHTGRLARTDGASFSKGEAISILERVSLALSLALGRRVACTLPVGYLHGIPTWTHWGTVRVDPLTNSSDWLDDTRTASQISRLIHRVLVFTSDPANMRAFKNALDYYLAASVDVKGHLQASLPISGLQLLTYYNFVTVGPYSPKQWDDTVPRISGTEWEIRKLLGKMGIAIAIPRHFRYLANVRRRMRKKGAHADALGVVIKMRNVATHPTKQQSGDYEIYEWVEAALLANYWLCLALLFTIGYGGDVAAVLQPRARYAGELRGTPWSKGSKRPWRVGGKPDRT
jgi:hypothetical protein